MTAPYRLNGALGSPYSLKMRALMRYRHIPHLWVHGAETQGVAAAKVKAPVIPVIEYPDGSFHNDSTPMIEDLDRRHPDRSVFPVDPAIAFLACLIEDFADEWLTKAMFGYRWLGEADQRQMSEWLAFDTFKGGGKRASQAYAATFRERQVGRMAIVGCTTENFPLIERSARLILAALEHHVTERHCLFGTRPSLAEFAVYGQLSQLGVDPTPAAMMRVDYPYTFRWLLHIDDMSGVDGAWDPPGTPLPEVVPAMLSVIGAVYLPFLVANAAASAAGETEVALTAMDLPYRQGVFRYQVKCLAALRRRYAALGDAARATVDPLLARSGCLNALAGAST